MLYKGRDRILRGKIKSFEDLPDYAKINFKLIKDSVCKLLAKEVEVFVYGSFLHGYWDKDSDFDVIINDECDTLFIEESIINELGIKNNVLVSNTKIGLVLIP